MPSPRDDEPDERTYPRRDWPADVQVFLEVVGKYLEPLPPERRGEVMADLTRHIMAHKTQDTTPPGVP